MIINCAKHKGSTVQYHPSKYFHIFLTNKDTRDDKTVIGTCTLGMTKSSNCAIISQTRVAAMHFSSALLVCLSLQNRCVLPGSPRTHQLHL